MSWTIVSVYTMKSSWNSNSNTMKCDRPQHDHPSACVIAQQYSSASFISRRFNSSKKFRYIIFVPLCKSRQCETVLSRGVAVVWATGSLLERSNQRQKPETSSLKLRPHCSCSYSGSWSWIVLMWTGSRVPIQAAQATGSCVSDCCRYIKGRLASL